MLARLSGEPPLDVPAAVIIPAGCLSAEFPIAVGEDAYLDPVPWEVAITAQTEDWPPAVALQGLVDNEDESWQALEVPAEIVEGRTGKGRLVVRTPRVLPFVVHVDTPNAVGRARLNLPLDFTFPAGVVEHEFTLSVPDNDRPDPELNIDLSVTGEGNKTYTGMYVRVLDDDGVLDGVVLGYGLPPAVLSGQPFHLQAALVNTLQDAHRTNLTGQIELLASPEVAQLAPGSGTILFTNGIWEGDVTVLGEALGIQLKVAAGGREAVSPRFDLLPGQEYRSALADAQWWSAGGKFLIVEQPGAGQPSRLVEWDPLTGKEGRSLNLPVPANLLSLAESGEAAWLTSPSNALLRVDLAGWRFDRQFPLVPGQSEARAGALLMLPLASERVAVAVTTNGDWGPFHLQLYADGRLLPDSVELEVAPQPLILIPGRSPAELFCHAWGTLSRFVITDEGVSPDRSHWFDNVGSLERAGDLLIAGNGQTASAETLEAEAPFSCGIGERVCLPPGPAWGVFLDHNGELGFFDLATRQRLTSHAAPVGWLANGEPLGAADRFLAWGKRGLALLYRQAGVLQTFESPALRQDRPDLAVALRAPARVDLSSVGGFVEFTVEIAVTNRGLVSAPGVTLRWDTEGEVALGTLAPGESFRTNVAGGTYDSGQIIVRASVGCAIEDATPSDNAAEVAIACLPPDTTGVRQPLFGINHLVASPDRTRLFASLSRNCAALSDGIAIVDPERGVVERFVPVSGDPRRLALSDDGRFVYVQLGSSTIARWNLEAGTNDVAIDVSPESISDFLALAGAPQSAIVATEERVQVFDDAQPRPGDFRGPDTERFVELAGGTLWVSEAGWLRSFAIGAGGLEAGVSMAFPSTAGKCDFSTDGRRLYFIGTVFDSQTLQVQPAPMLLELSLPELSTGSLYTTAGRMLRRLGLDDLTVQSEQALAQALTEGLSDLVRWGTDGLAVRSGPQLLLARSPLVSAGTTSDLGVTVSPPLPAFPGIPQDWLVQVTNHSEHAAARTRLILRLTPLPGDLVVDGPAFDQVLSDLHFDLGDLAGGESVAVRLRGSMQADREYEVTASVLSAATDPDPEDNAGSARAVAASPRADLGVLAISAPQTVPLNEEFAIRGLLTNAGSDTVHGLVLSSTASGYLDLRALGCDDCQTNQAGAVFLAELGPGESHEVELRLVAKEPGLHVVMLSLDAPCQDSDPANNAFGTVVFALPQSGHHEPSVLRVPHGSQFAWDEHRRQLIAACPGLFSGLVTLNPRTLVPVNRVPVPGQIIGMMACRDGRHAWVYTGSGFVRVNFDTGQPDQQFELEFLNGVWAMACQPGQPDILAVVQGDGFLRVFNAGQPQANRYGPLPFMPSLMFTSAGHLFVSARSLLRELRLGPGGPVEMRNLDAAASWSETAYTEADGRLFSSAGTVVDLATGAVAAVEVLHSGCAADAEMGAVYEYLDTSSHVQFPLQLRDARSLEPVWRMEVPGSAWNSKLVPMGTNGVLLALEGRALVLTPENLPPKATDFAVHLVAPNTAGGVGFDFPLVISITNRSPWAVRPAQLRVSLDAGLELAAGEAGAGSREVAIDLGAVLETTNCTVRVHPTAVGAFAVQVSVLSGLPDANPADDEAGAVITVPPLPRLFLDHIVLAEGDTSADGAGLRAWLSRPAPGAFEVPFAITPATAQADDFRALSGSFAFVAGQQSATVQPVRGDTTPEMDETAGLELQPTADCTLARGEILLTIANDDWPQMKVGDVAVTEGDTQSTNATFRISLTRRAPFPVDCRFLTVPMTATPGSDYLERGGWLRFEPGQDTMVVEVPVLGDLAYEPDETVAFSLLEARGALLTTVGLRLTIRNDDARRAPRLGLSLGGGASLRLDFATDLGVLYRLETRTNLTTDGWRPLGEALPGTGQSGGFEMDRPAGEAYFRVKAD